MFFSGLYIRCDSGNYKEKLMEMTRAVIQMASYPRQAVTQIFPLLFQNFTNFYRKNIRSSKVKTNSSKQNINHPCITRS